MPLATASPKSNLNSGMPFYFFLPSRISRFFHQSSVKMKFDFLSFDYLFLNLRVYPISVLIILNAEITFLYE